jgi:beta-phosphoglucomutase family hydrolase
MLKEAVIFDMDGVISDTQKLHAEAESCLLRDRFNISITPVEITDRFAGVRDSVMFEQILVENGIPFNLSQVSQLMIEKWDAMYTITAKTPVEPIPHALELIAHLRENNFKLAIASASNRLFIEYVIDSLDIRDNFDTFVSSQEVENGKPAPDVFLKAAEILGVKPECCVVIEDGRSGMIGAHCAGMKCIGLVAKKDYSEWCADLLVTSLSEIQADTIHKL